MKWIVTAALLVFSVLTATAEVSGVKTVYVLPMAGGLDQYLALQLTSQGVLQVVTDPQKADAILTDGIGAGFEQNLTELYGAPVSKQQADKDADKDKDKTEFAHPPMRPLSGSRGVIFLVNRSSRDVLWSTFERPKSTQPDELKHAAEKIVERLAKAQKAK